MFNLETIGLSAIRKITDLWNAARADSLIDYTAVTRVEPITIVDSHVMYNEMLHDVLQCLNSQFAGYYLQAFAISMNVGKIETVRHLDKLNPARNPATSVGDSAGWLLAQESYKHHLPSPSNKVAMERDRVETEVILAKDTIASVQELTNLSVGKMVNVQISDGNHTATIPISIRLMVTSIPSTSLNNLLIEGARDNSAKERYHAWREGRLEFVKDLIFCQDIIDAHKKNLLKDSTGVYGEILARRRKNQISTLFSGNPSIATASNLLVVSAETVRQVEGEIGGRLKDFKTREKIFGATYLMIIAVIDEEWDRVTFYHRGIATPTELNKSGLKAANKGTGPDVAEILKAYQLGSSPSL